MGRQMIEKLGNKLHYKEVVEIPRYNQRFF
jgi:hypothetical protein